MERIIIGLAGYVIKKIITEKPLVLEVEWTVKPICPCCDSQSLRTKDSFRRNVKSVRLRDRPSLLRIKCHKYACLNCGRYFNTRLSGVKACKLLDEEHIAYGRGGLIRLLMTKRERLRPEQQIKLRQYFETQPALQAVYEFCHELSDLLRVKGQTHRNCLVYIHELLARIKGLSQSPWP